MVPGAWVAAAALIVLVLGLSEPAHAVTIGPAFLPMSSETRLCLVAQPCMFAATDPPSGVPYPSVSPIDGVGPDALGVDVLVHEVRENAVTEVILATNPTVEGEATALLLIEALKRTGARSSRIAHGVPIGGELEYVDGGTIVHALQGRRSIG